jgi:creatinine amidohydrolase/Fe(II)-dependent formamide hydrolase-like protein
MTELILIEIAAVPAERSRGRHNPRVVKRKMSNFPTKSRSAARAAPARCLRYHEHIVIVAPPEPVPPVRAGRHRAVPTTRQTQPVQTNHQTFWQAHVQAWRASGLRRAVYCQQHNLKPQAFNAAVARLRQTVRHAPKTASTPV